MKISHKKNYSLFLQSYKNSLNIALDNISKKNLIKASALIEKTIKKKNLFMCVVMEVQLQ